MFSFAGAKELTRKENPEIYNIVENLCISRGVSMPKI
jgi:heat shock protein HtpX